MSEAQTYARENRARFLEQFKDSLRIASVSTDPAFKGEMDAMVSWLLESMQRIGLTAEAIPMPEGRYPVVLGNYTGAGDDAPTILIYSHYDVQPAVVADGWHSDPFEPVERDGRLYARGSSDTKIHVNIWLNAVEALIATGTCPVNIRLLFEGEEESGGETIKAFVTEQAERVAADVAVISDGSITAPDQPCLIYGLRGIITMEMHLTGPQRDLHSGHFGGIVHNPIHALNAILAQLHDDSGRVTVPGFYDDVVVLDVTERDLMAANTQWVESEWEQVANAPSHWGEAGFSLHERTGARPTLEINGISGGYTGDGFKTVLPSKAMAKISCRLVPNQDPDRIRQQVVDYIQSLVPPTMQAEIIALDAGAPAVLLDRQSPAMRAAAAAYEHAWHVAPLYERAGGSVPVTYDILNITDTVVMMGFTYKGGGAHGPDEHAILAMFERGTQAAIHFLETIKGEL